MATRLVFDTANLFFRVAAASSKGNEGSPEELAALALRSSIFSLRKYYKKYKPDQIAVTFEGSRNWRKDYTRSDRCESGWVYKSNRVKDSSMETFFAVMKSFEELARNHTSLICLSNPQLEGDDLFSGYAERFAEQGDTVIGVSGDKDFVQLLRFPNFTLVNPEDGKPRETDDPYLFMFEKCFRGDRGDYVMSAYPRLRKTKIDAAFTDEYLRTQLMNHKWKFTDVTTGKETEYEVRKIWEENKLLMDLTAQPPEIKEIIQQTLDEQLENHGKFSLFDFIKFCGKYKLQEIAENSTQFADVFSAKKILTEKKTAFAF